MSSEFKIKEMGRVVVDANGRPAREGTVLVLRPGQVLPAEQAAKLGLTGGKSAPAGKEPTVKEVLAEVGEDQAKAAAALEAELAKGKKARKSLVEALQAIAGKEA